MELNYFRCILLHYLLRVNLRLASNRRTATTALVNHTSTHANRLWEPAVTHEVRHWDKATIWGYKYPAHSAGILFEHSHLLSLFAIGFIPAAMERVRKTFFNPLAASKGQVQKILEDLPVGSAHPFSLEQILLCRTENGIEEIDISSYPENFFFNAMDLGEMGEILLRRMAGFQSHLSMSSLSNEYMDGEVNIHNMQRYSRTSKLCKHQHQHLRSLSSQIKLRF
jgi:hypothetical protein